MSRPLAPSPPSDAAVLPPRMEYGVYSIVGRSLVALVAMPATPSTSSSAEAVKKRAHLVMPDFSFVIPGSDRGSPRNRETTRTMT